MNTTLDFLQAVKVKTGINSDYGIAPILGVTRAAVSNYRRKHGYFDDLVCVRVAEILEIDPIIVISAINAERSKDEKTRLIWANLYEKFGGVAAAVLIGVGLIGAPNLSKAELNDHFVKRVYYVKSRKNRRLYNPLAALVQSMMCLA